MFKVYDESLRPRLAAFSRGTSMRVVLQLGSVEWMVFMAYGHMLA